MIERNLSFITIFLNLILLGNVSAGNYHVAQNVPGASDLNPGTEQAPFLTISKAATVAVAGDTVFVHGGIYRETITPVNSGTAGNLIVYMPYENEKVTVSGADVITGWELHEGHIYKAPMPSDFFVSSVNMTDQVFFNGKMMNLARWPNMGLEPSYPVKAVTNSFISKEKDSVTNLTTGVMKDDDLPEGDYVGAEIYMQPNNGGWSWTFTGTVTDVSGTQFTFESFSGSGKDFEQNVYHPQSRYYFYNLLSLLDTAGEWYHDKENEWLYLWLPDNADPTNHVIEAKARDYGFNLTEKSYIEIHGFHIFACNITTDDVSGGDGQGYTEDGTPKYPWRGPGSTAESHHITIDGIHCLYPSHSTDVSGHFFFQYGSHSGIVLSGENHVLQNSVIRYSFANAVSLLGNDHLVHNNLIEDINYAACGYGAIGQPGSKATDCIVSYNTIRRTGRSGIRLGIRNSDPSNIVARIHHNEISDFMLQDQDGGGIYMGSDGGFLRIDHNIIHDGKGYIVSGIYPDWGKNYIYHHNVIYNVWATFQFTHSYKDEGVNNYVVYNNTAVCTNNDKFVNGPFNFVCSGGKEGVILKNNIGWVYSPPAAGNYKFWNDGTTFNEIEKSHNLMAEDPLLMGYPDNFQLQPASPAIDAGEPMDTVILEGVTIPPFNDPVTGTMDIGAYEFGIAPFEAGSSLDTTDKVSIQIHAAGKTGTEGITLMIRDNPVAVFENVGGNTETGEFEILEATVKNIVSPEMVKLWFTNYESGKELRIDKIVIDGKEYQTEDVISSCTTDNTEFLDCNGFFHYKPKPVYTLTIIADNGTVELDPPGGEYNEGTRVTLTAFPDDGYAFSGWSGDASGNVTPKVINMKQDRVITATFSPVSGIKGLDNQAKGVLLYPNPAGDNTFSVQLNNTWKGNITFALYDSKGRICFQRDETLAKGENTFTFSEAAFLSPGVYIVKISSEVKTVHRCLMVK